MKLDRQIVALESALDGAGSKTARRAGAAGKVVKPADGQRRPMSAAARKAVSQRMKKQRQNLSQLVRGALRAWKWARQGVRRKRRAMQRTWRQVGQGVQRGRRVVRRTWKRTVLRTWKRAVLRTWKSVRHGARRAAWLIGAAARVNPLYSPAGEQHTCPACGRTRIKHLDVRRWQSRGNDQQAGFISGCVSCGLVFANPMPTPEALAKLYAPRGRFFEHYKKRWGEGRGTTVSLPSFENRRRLSQRFATVAPHLDMVQPPAGVRVLDYGCGSGKMLDQLQAVGWSTFGFEPGLRGCQKFCV